MRRKKQGPDYTGPCRADRKFKFIWRLALKISAFINDSEIKCKKKRNTERGTYLGERKEKKTNSV